MIWQIAKLGQALPQLDIQMFSHKLLNYPKIPSDHLFPKQEIQQADASLHS
jgi:hypothetical protein